MRKTKETAAIVELANYLCKQFKISDSAAQVAVMATLEKAFEVGRQSALGARPLDPTPPDPGATLQPTDPDPGLQPKPPNPGKERA